MDTFQKCRLASEKVAWNFQAEFGDLQFDFGRRFLPTRLCGAELPSWLSPERLRDLNQLRGYSYAHLFGFVEEFIIHQTCTSATEHMHADGDALSALLNFANEETKHQRLFETAKDLIASAVGFRPPELPGKVDVARAICGHSPFAVYMLTLMIEWLTQRHYIECFHEEETDLDPGFVRIFRLHWTEEALHARIDALELQALASSLPPAEIEAAIGEFVNLVHILADIVRGQDRLDIAAFERRTGDELSADHRAELLAALHRESIWIYILSGLEHRAFRSVFSRVVPPEMVSIELLSERIHAGLDEVTTMKKPAAAIASAERTHKVALVVDDQEAIRVFAQSTLERLGFEVLAAEDGAEAMAIFSARADDVSLVLLDLTLPGMSGDEVLEAIHSTHPDVSVIISSGRDRGESLGSTPAEAAAGYLQKPYRMADLERAVAGAGRSTR